jgi:hypothetical protein
VVETDERAAWENYTMENEAWVNEGLEVQKEDETFKGNQVEEWSGWGVIHSNDGPVEEPGPYLPTWQTAPVVPFYSPYNWNLYSYFRPEMDELIKNQKVVISLTRNLPLPGETEVSKEDRNVQWVQGFIGEDDIATEPMTALYYPVIDKAGDVVTAHEDTSAKLVGVIASTFFWRELIKDILPEGTHALALLLVTCLSSVY